MFYRIISRKLPDNRSILKVDYKMFYHLCWGTRLICRRRPGNISRIKYVGKPPKQQQINPKNKTNKKTKTGGPKRSFKAAPSSHIPARRKKGGFRATYFLKTVLPSTEQPVCYRQPAAGPAPKCTNNISRWVPTGETPEHLGTRSHRTCGVQPAMQLHTQKKLLRLATCGTTFHWLHLKRFLQEEDVLEEKQTSEYEGRPLLILFHVPKVHFSRFNNNNNIKNNNTIYLFIPFVFT